MDSPVINERYEGNRGRTQGERKEIRPAQRAMIIVTCPELSKLSFQPPFKLFQRHHLTLQIKIYPVLFFLDLS